MKQYHPLSPTGTLDERKQQALDQCDQLIQDFIQRADRHKGRYQRLKTASIALAIGTTIISAVSASKVLGTQLDWVVPVFSGFATISTTLLSQSHRQKMWVQSRNTAQQFQTELFLYLQSGGDYGNVVDDADRLKLFSTRLMAVWSQAQDDWAQHAAAGK
jgi:hypothetical protein